MVALGHEEYFDPEGVTIVEWADKVQGLLPEKHVLVAIRIAGRTTREIEIELVGPWRSRSASEIADALERAAAEQA